MVCVRLDEVGGCVRLGGGGLKGDDEIVSEARLTGHWFWSAARLSL